MCQMKVSFVDMSMPLHLLAAEVDISRRSARTFAQSNDFFVNNNTLFPVFLKYLFINLRTSNIFVTFTAV